MNYPNGQAYSSKPKAKLDAFSSYKENKKKTTYGKRGMALEDMLNASNNYYHKHQKAVIYKKPTPIQIVKVDYPKRTKAKITEAYYRRPSTTDYNGVYNGFYIDFEAKQTDNLTRFPLSNFHEHQLQHMEDCVNQKGVVFAIILFTKRREAFLYPFNVLKEDWENYKKGKTSSIPYTRIKKEGFLIPMLFQPELDYLTAVDEYLKTNR